jgi:hypothetical protein
VNEVSFCSSVTWEAPAVVVIASDCTGPTPFASQVRTSMLSAMFDGK